jgi:ribose transport system substrate-binding protein
MKMSTKLIGALVPLALLAAACGNDDSGSSNTQAPATTAPSGGGDAVAEGLARAKAAIDNAAAPPEKIGPTIPLTSAPGPKKVAWLECEQPSCAAITPGFVDATNALGWELIVIPADSFAQGPAIQQALNAGANYIAHTGSPLATADEEIAAAKAAGVPYASCYSTDDPDFANNNLLMQCGDEEAVKVTGALMANWAIVDSGGAATVLIVNIPDFPVLIAEADAAKAAYAENCPNCAVQELNVTIAQLIAGEVPGAVASAIQANQAINYLQFTFGDLPAGVADTLQEAGLLAGRKIIGVDFSTQIGLVEIIAGRHAAWTSNPKPYAAWLMVDAFARHAVGMDNPEERQNAALNTFIVSDAASAQEILNLGDAGWPGPATMADQFRALWGK